MKKTIFDRLSAKRAAGSGAFASAGSVSGASSLGVSALAGSASGASSLGASASAVFSPAAFFPALLALAAAVFMAIPAFAQDVTIVGPPCTFHVWSSLEEDAVETEKEVEHFQLFGRAGEDRMLIRTEEEDEYILKEELQNLLPELDCDAYPQVEDVQTFSQGASGDSVKPLQQTLADLGYLSGKVDGDYGRGTAEAVRKFQEDHSLEVTGDADLYTMLLITAIGGGMEESLEVISKGYDSPAEKFPQIADKTEADLEAFMEPKWRFRFDVFTQTGTIDPSIKLGSFSVEEPAIDQIEGDLSLKVLVRKEEASGLFVLVPAIEVKTTGAYRPYIQGAVLAGEDVLELGDAEKTGKAEGVKLLETADISLTKEAVEMLKSGSVQSIRLLGKNISYDIDVEDGDREAFMEACAGLVE